MKKIFKEYGFLLVTLISGAISIFMMMSVIDNQMILTNSVVSADDIVIGVQTDYELPKIEQAQFKVTNAILKKGNVFDWKEHIEVIASNGADLKKYVVMKGNVDTSKIGSNEVKFILNWNGHEISKSTVFYVEE